jgi:hypothetical protein
MRGKKNMNDTAHARSAGGQGFRLRVNILKSWTFASHLNWPVPPSRTETFVQELTTEASKFLVQKIK